MGAGPGGSTSDVQGGWDGVGVLCLTSGRGLGLVGGGGGYTVRLDFRFV